MLFRRQENVVANKTCCFYHFYQKRRKLNFWWNICIIALVKSLSLTIGFLIWLDNYIGQKSLVLDRIINYWIKAYGLLIVEICLNIFYFISKWILNEKFFYIDFNLHLSMEIRPMHYIDGSISLLKCNFVHFRFRLIVKW